MAQFTRAYGSRGFPDGRGFREATRAQRDHAGFEVEEIRARYVHAARGLVVKHVDEVELRVVVAAVLAVAADAVLVAHNLLQLGKGEKERMNTASKLGPHTQTDRGTCPGVGL